MHRQIRSLAKKYGLQSGDGPSEDAMQNGWMDVRTTARSVDGKSFARARFVSRGDPGYAATSYMICETALGLVHDYDQLSDLAKEGGHLTAAWVSCHICWLDEAWLTRYSAQHRLWR